MRIVSGEFRGRTVQAPAGQATRPTSDRARQAVFNILEHAPWSAGVRDARVIDLFAGAGGMSSGFASAGYRAVAAIEVWDAAATSFRAAHPSAAVIVAAVEAVSGRLLLRSAGLVRGECMLRHGRRPALPSL